MTLFTLIGILVVLSPAALLAIVGLTAIVGKPLGERALAICTQVAVLVGLTASLTILLMMLALNIRDVPIELGNWVVIPEQHFHFHLKFMFDRLSVPFVILTFLLTGIVGAFTRRYLHREPGYGRYFVFYSIFLLGMVVSSSAGTVETLFFGWELVGLSSALLVAFFHERRNPVRNGQRVWIVYRIADAAFLIAALTMHHLTGAGEFSTFVAAGGWPASHTNIAPTHALFVGLLLLVAAAGKSALIPFSGWLPRAMEGPTTSSAVFYGALSVHLGAFLLLRFSPIIEASFALSVLVVLLGLSSAIYGACAAQVQSDVKSALGFASLTQVGLIIAEIGFGFRYIALIHIIGHACLRTLQLLRAPSLLQDYHTLKNAIGVEHALRKSPRPGRVPPEQGQDWWYRFAIERGFLDAILNEYIVRPFVVTFRWCDRMERRWTDFLSGGEACESPETQVQSESMKEFA